jgi:hypothetical protein
MVLTLNEEKYTKWVSHYENTCYKTTVDMKKEQIENKVQIPLFSCHLNLLVAAIPLNF